MYLNLPQASEWSRLRISFTPLPQGTIESCIRIEEGDGGWYYHVEYSPFLQLIHKIYLEDAKALMSKLEETLLHFPNDNSDLRPLLDSIFNLLRKMLVRNEQV